MHTLIVDDHAFVCVGLKATLLDGLSDIQVSTASDGPAALDILVNESIDLAIIDLFMPGGDGGFDFISTVVRPTLHFLSSYFPDRRAWYISGNV